MKKFIKIHSLCSGVGMKNLIIAAFLVLSACSPNNSNQSTSNKNNLPEIQEAKSGLITGVADFGVLAHNSTSVKLVAFTIKNNGTEPLLGPASLDDSSIFSLTYTNCPESLAKTKSCTVRVSVDPRSLSAGFYTTNLSFDTVSVQLSVTKDSPPAVAGPSAQFLVSSAVIESLDYGVVPKNSTIVKTVSVKNLTEGVLNSTVVVNNPLIYIASDGCSGKNIAKNGTCNLKISISGASMTEDLESSLTYADISLPVTAQMPEVIPPAQLVKSVQYSVSSVVVSTVDFGDLTDSQSVLKTIAVKNNGEVVLSENVSLANGNYNITYDTCSGKNIAINGSCQLKISLVGSGKDGSVLDTLSYGGKDLELIGNVASVASGGNGSFAPNIVFMEGTTQIFANPYDMGTWAGAEGSQLIINVKNIGNLGAVASNAVLTSGVNFSMIFNQCSNKALGINESCQVRISFSASGKAVGDYTDTLTFGSVSLPLAGHVASCPVGKHSNPITSQCELDVITCSVDQGSGTQTWTGSEYAACVVDTCLADYHIEDNSCLSNIKSCPIDYGTGIQTWLGNSYTDCMVDSCLGDYHIEDNTCQDNIRSCDIDHGMGLQSWLGSQYEECQVQDCDISFHIENNSCFSNERDCNGFELSAINAASGTATWISGTDYHCVASSCENNYHISGEICEIDQHLVSINSGTNGQVSGGISGNYDYGTSFNLTAIPDSGYQFTSWSGGPCDLSSNPICSFSVSEPVSMLANFDLICPVNQHDEEGTCVNDLRSCSISNGQGEQTWAAGSWGSCFATSCEYSYLLISGSCIFTEPYKLASYNVSQSSQMGQIGASYNCAYKSDSLNCWGASHSRGYANGSFPYSTVAVNVDMTGVLAGKTFIDVQSGQNFSCGLADDNKIYCWGLNNYYQLGVGISPAFSSTPVAVNNTAFASKTVDSISVGQSSVCALMTDQTAYCWGSGIYGILGNGSSSNNVSPAQFQMLGALSGKTIKKISIGQYNTCVIANDNLPYCVGGNIFGALGNGDFTNSTVPVSVVTSGVLSGKTIKDIVTNEYNTCAIASDNKVYCWGYGGQGQLGNGVTSNSNVPVAVTTTGVLSGKNILKVVVGSNHSCVIASDSKVYCWGISNNNTWQNGTGSTAYTPVAVAAGSLNGKNLIDISTNSNTTCAIDSTFKAHCWGGNDVGQKGNATLVATTSPTSVNVLGLLAGKNLIKVAAGRAQTCALDSTGEAYCWGSADYGNLGNPNYYSKITIPQIGYMNGSLSGKTIKYAAVGYSHGCLIASDDQVYCWGDNSKGQIGNNDTSFAATPQAVVNTGVLNGKTIKSLYVGNEVTCVIASDDQSYCWGLGSKGQLGNNSAGNSLVPVAVITSGVLSGKTIKSMSLGYQHTCAIASDNQAYCWGYNNYGQVGNNGSSVLYAPAAVTTSGTLSGKSIKKLYAGWDFTCAIASDNQAYCWGYNSGGQLGTNDQTNKMVPAAVNTAGSLSGKTVKELALGYQHTCAIASDNKAYCWGYGYSNQIGTGTAGLYTTPQAVSTSGDLNGKNIIKIYAGIQQSCVIDSDNLSYCWGQLGVGNSSGYSAVPVATSRPGNLAGKTFLDMYLGYKTSCATMSDMNIYCFGRVVEDGEYGAPSTTTFPLYKVQLPEY